MDRKVNPLSQFVSRLTLSAGLVLVSFGSLAAGHTDDVVPARAPNLAYRVVAQYPHDIHHFTQGLEISDGKLLESAGGYGVSSIYLKDLRTGAVERSRELPPFVFGEGLTLAGGRIFVLTWREHLGMVFDRSFRPVAQFELEREGWGITHMPTPAGERLIMSDGSASLFEFDPASMKQTRAIPVHDGAKPVEKLNELEYARGDIYSNVWLSDLIAVIRPSDGAVHGWLDMSGLKMRFDKPEGWNPLDHVLNGIAYDESSGHFFVTGKCWPVLFEIQVDKGIDSKN